MGGLGSGRRRDRQRVTAECCLDLDADSLAREGLFRPGAEDVWRWFWDGGEVGSVGLHADPFGVHLSFRHGGDGETGFQVNEFVPVERVPCHFGGERHYFRCPGIDCARRVVKLYADGPVFLCRYCHGLAYASQFESLETRARRRAAKIRMKLGQDPSMAPELPERPSRMCGRAYRALIDKLIAAEILAASEFARRFKG